MNQLYLHTARLLTQVAPLVFVDGTFALKDIHGGLRLAAASTAHPVDEGLSLHLR